MAVEIKDDLEGINEPLDEESKKIIDEMKAENKPEKKDEPEGNKGSEKKEEKLEEKVEEKVEEKKEEKKDDGEDGDKKPEKTPRTPKMMPAWEHEKSKSQWGKEKEQLESQIAELSKKVDSKDTKPEQADAIKKFAEKHNWDEETVKDFLDLAGLSSLEKKVMSKFEGFEKHNSEVFQEQEFSTDYSKKVSPLLKADNISEDKTDQVKKIIHDLAFTEKYAKNDLDDVYLIAKQKGFLDDYLPVERKKSAENSRGGASGVTGKEKGEDTLEEIMEKSDEDFEKWSDEQGKKQSSRTYSVPGQ